MTAGPVGGHPAWRKAGRCSACVFFAQDFDDPPDVLGHCKMYPRPGSRSSSDFACPEYRPLAGFDDLTRSVDAKVHLVPGPPKPLEIPSHRPRPPRGPLPPPSSAVVRRRAGEDVVPVSRPLGRRTLPEDVLDYLGTELGLVDPSPDSSPDPGAFPVDTARVRDLLLSVIENFIGVQDVEMLARFQGGTLVIKPENAELQPKEVPLEAFFHKIVMVRDNLRRLEQKVNAHEGLSDADKVEIQQYISRCYGSLTTFNILFKNERDKFSSR
jgi:hypothetical protein